MAEDITLKVITEAKSLQGKINEGTLPKDTKALLSAKLSEALNLLSKGALASAKDLNIVSTNIKTIINELVKSAAGVKGISKELINAQKALEESIAARDKILKERSTLKRTKISDAGTLRTAEANRLTEAEGVEGKRGNIIKTYETLVKAAQTNEAAKIALESVDRKFQEYKTTLDTINNVTLPAAEADVQAKAARISEIKESAPETSMAVQMQEFGNELQNLIGTLKQVNTEAKVQDIQEQGVDPSADIQKLSQTTQKASSSFGKAFKQFSIYAIALRSIKQAAKEAVATIKELDHSLTEQAMVTGKTRKQTYALLEEYQNLAAQTGATTREIAELATQFVRQGKTTQDALTLTKAAMDAAKVAGISAIDSVNYLTTALNGFQMSAQDAMLVSDKFAMIAANSATSYDEIATALSKVASQANLAGMSIDYTTALLAKGLETTREAPETMGTALKTIIARMREISDYGETLSGDTNINNVESQLAYVGIALKDTNGELRSTEDVLDELGKKWNTLSNNQQAAIAKALAGTRQQSRLIAMMTDYERVTELQQISQRSAGATLAQMETYLEGMDAALNKVNVAWEKIITSIVNNDAIIDFINLIASFLENLEEFLSTDFGTIALLTTIATLTLSTVNNKLLEISISKQQQKYDIERQKTELKINKLKAQAYINANKVRIEEEKQTLTKKQQLITELQLKKSRGQLTLEEQQQLHEAEQYVQLNETRILQEETELKAAEFTVKTYDSQLQLLNNQKNVLSNIFSIFGGIVSMGTMLFGIFKSIATVSSLIVSLTKKETREQIKARIATEKAAAAKKIKAAFSMADSAAATPITGWIIAAGIIATLVGTTIAITTSRTNAYNRSAEKAATDINKLSSEIYKLESKSRAIDTVVNSYNELDNQLIKTQVDQEKMNTLLDEAADKLDENEQKAYKALITNQQRIDYLKSVQANANQQADIDRQQQLRRFNISRGSNRARLLDEHATDADILSAQSALYAINNAALYDYIDNLSEADDGVEKLTQSLLEQLSVTDALNYANNPERIDRLVKSLNKLRTTSGGIVAELLTADDGSILEKLEAYKTALVAIPEDLQDEFKQLYSDLETFTGFNDRVLEFIDKSGVTIANINDISTAIQKLGYTSDESTNKLEQLFAALESGLDLQTAIYDIFGQLNDETYSQFLNAYTSIIGTGILNMGQNVEALKNQIDSFYEKAMKWAEMADSEKTAFLADNASLFAGEEGKELLEAIESGDYNFIQNALGNNEALREKVSEQIKIIDQEIALENAKLEQDRDYAYLKYLQDQKQVLQDADNLYAASLETRLEQQQKFLDEYKSYLEDQRDALKDSLDERKQAYSDYFETVNQEAEDQDFEEKEQTLIANIAKLATSTSAEAVNQRAKLEQELVELEKERLQDLRERAQEAIVENIDDTIESIDKKFDELLNSQQALLAAMTGELDNPEEFLSNLIVNKMQQEGLTSLGLQSYIQDLQSVYGSILGNNIFDNVSVEQQGNQLILNVAGKEIVLSDSEQQSVYTAIMNALQQIGYR